MAKRKHFPYLTPKFIDGVVVTKYPENVSKEKLLEVRGKAKELARRHSYIY